MLGEERLGYFLVVLGLATAVAFFAVDERSREPMLRLSSIRSNGEYSRALVSQFLVYGAAFGGGSHTIHGNWMDLIDYHLEDVDSGFGPQLKWRRPRPQLLFMIATLATEAIGEYFVPREEL